jgi:KEOPS complex subunit Cgi121
MVSAFSIHQARVSVSDCKAFLDLAGKIGSCHETRIVFFNAEKMAGKVHAESALSHALRAEREITMISHRMEMEALLYASGSRQILHGASFGVHTGENLVYVCLCPGNERTWENLAGHVNPADGEYWEAISPEKMAFLCAHFSITPEELEVVESDRIVELVLERVALLDVYR